MTKESECYQDLVLRRDGDKWVAEGEIDNATAMWTFNGEGSSKAEAIGSYMINNREALRFQFGFVGDDGNVKLSTVFNCGRTADQMGPNEKRLLPKQEGK